MAGHDHALPGSTSLAESAAATRRATLYSVTVATVLIALKLVAWRASGSVALLSSLADSGLDLIASLITFGAVRYAVVAPDAEHAFGHGKAEAFSSLIQAALVFASAALVGREVVLRLFHPEPVGDGLIATAVMAASVVLTGLLVALQTQALKKTRSVAIAGDRAHYFADLGGNLVGLVGVAAAAWLHILWLDSAAGLFIVAWLVWGAIGVFREAADQLMDKGLDASACARIRDLAQADPRMLGVHELRTRVSGPYVMVQMHADLDPALTIEAAHEIMVAAENRILAEFPAADILIHPDPRGRAARHGGPFVEAPHTHEPQGTPVA
jgi:cation diffusion facilitator family transporter